jgi:cinnamyl-alcohol dehydrogenase
MFRFCSKIPDTLASDVAAPLLCAGITVDSPMMRHHMNQAGKSLGGVIGLGGLGHMAVKFGKAFGLHVTVLSTSLAKEGEALCVLGADAFTVSKDEAAMRVFKNFLPVWILLCFK